MYAAALFLHAVRVVIISIVRAPRSCIYVRIGASRRGKMESRLHLVRGEGGKVGGIIRSTGSGFCVLLDGL